MVQMFQGLPDKRMEAVSSIGQGIGQGIAGKLGSFYANKALEDTLNDKELQEKPLSERWQALQTNMSKYGTHGQKVLENRLKIEQQKYSEEQAKLQKKEDLEKENRLFTQQKELQTLKNQGKAPAGGVTAQQVPPETANKINRVLKENSKANSDELRLAMDEAGIEPVYSNPYTENRRRMDEQNSKTSETKTAAYRQETLPIRKQLADKAIAASQGIQNKKHLLDLIEKGDINDPTFAALAESFPLNLGKRLLSNDTVEYKAGMIEEFGDLKNIFPGQVRVKEIELLEQKMADLYLTDDQKKSILGSRINALRADVIRAEVAQEIENEPIGVLQFQQEVDKRAKPKLDALFNQILDEQKSIIQNAENRKKLPLDMNEPDDKKIAESILKEAGGNRNKAREIAKQKGYSF